MKTIWLAGIVVVALGATTAWGAEAQKLPTGDEVLAKMQEKWAGMKSYEVDQKSTVDYEGRPAGMVSSMHLTADRQEKDGKRIERDAMTMKRVTKKEDGKEVVVETKVVKDGQFAWTEIRDGAEKEIRVRKGLCPGGVETQIAVMVAWRAKILNGGWIADVQDMRGTKVVGEETIGGQKMYVLEGSWDLTTHGGEKRESKFWIGENDYFVWKYVATTEREGVKSVTTSEIANVKVDGKIAEEAFKYTPPTEAKVDDKTADDAGNGGGEGGGGGGGMGMEQHEGEG
jgi:outer membrane lipoprotein-sorting protein